MRRAVIAVLAILAILVTADPAPAGPIGYTIFYPNSSTPSLYTIDLGTGATSPVGPLGFRGFGLTASGGTLVGIGGSHPSVIGSGNYSLYTVNSSSGGSTLIGATGASGNFGGGLSNSPATGTTYLLSSDPAGVARLFTVSTATGAASLVGTDPNLNFANGLAINGSGAAFAVDTLIGAGNGEGQLFHVNLADGTLTALPNTLGIGAGENVGLAFGPGDNLYLLTGSGGIYTVDTTTGVANLVATAPTSAVGYYGLAFAAPVPEPAGLGFVGALSFALAYLVKRRKRPAAA